MTAKPLDSYIRVSKVGGREGDSYRSPDEQRRVIRETAKRHGVTLGVEVVEEDVSGHKRADERDLERLLERCESGLSAGIVVAAQDRLSRGSLKDQADVWERLGRASARLLTGDGLDSAAPGQELLFNIRAAIALDQWKRFRAGWSGIVRDRVARGLHHCATPPLGYAFGEGKRLVPSGDADLVREMFRRRIDGASHSDLARWLRTRGVEMTTQGVQKILRNRAYLGEARYGDLVTEGAHEALVDALAFDRAGAARGRGVRRARTGVVSDTSLMIGLATCSLCGRRLASATVRGGVQLRCLDAHHGPVTVAGHLLDAHVEKTVMTWQRKVRGFQLTRPSGEYRAAKAAAEAREAELGLFLSNLEAIGILGKSAWNAQAARHKAALDGARLALREAAEADEAPANYTRLGDRWLAASIPERRAMLSKVVERVVVSPVNGERGVPVESRCEIVLRERPGRRTGRRAAA